MTQNIRFEDWEAEQMRDPEFRAAVEELEPEYQEERRRMNQRQAERAKWVRDDMDARATERTRHVASMETARIQDIEFVKMLRSAVNEQAKRIEQLEAAAVEQHDRIGRLEAALETWLIVVNYDTAATPSMNEMDVG